MSHLTTSQIFQIIDGTIANGTKTELLAHLEACPRCRREVDFQRKLERAAKSVPLTRPSQKLTLNVMAKVAPTAGRSWISKLIDNLSSVLAMAFVLTVVWYSANIPVTPSTSSQPSMFGEVMRTYVDYYSRAREFVTQNEVQLMGEPAKERASKPEDVVLLTVLSILILVGIDRLVVRRVVKIRT
jgi:hypothetical protein